MRPNKLWTKPPLLIILALLLIPRVIYTQEENCTVQIGVRWNTVQTASSGQNMRIECPVHFCNNVQPVVSWCKLDDSDRCTPLNHSPPTETGWHMLEHNKGNFFLDLKNVSTNDTGQYRCKFQNDMGHSIDVSVSERADASTVVYEKSETSSFPRPNPDFDWLLPHIYPVVGVLGVVVVVVMITSILLMRRRRGQPKMTDPMDNKCIAIPMTQQALPHADIRPQHRASPRQPEPTLYDNIPSSRPPTRSAPTPEARPENRHQGNRKAGDRARDEEGLVYAALDHQSLRLAPGRPQEESTEYAAICLH